MKLTLGALLDMHAAIAAIPQSGISVDVLASIDLALNKQKIDPLVEGYKNSCKPSEEFEKYQAARRKIQEEEAMQKDGRPLIVENQYVFKYPAQAKEKILAHELRCKKVIDDQTTKAKAAEEALRRNREIDLIMVPRSAFSGSSATATLIMQSLLPIIRM